MEVRRLTEADAEAFWNIRLRALRDDPESFGASYTEILERGIAGITQGLGKSERAADDATFGAFLKTKSPDDHELKSEASAGSTDNQNSKKAKKRSGPKGPRNNPREDERLFNEWEQARAAGLLRSFGEFEKAKGYDLGTVKAAVKRHKERMRNLQ